MPKRMIDDHQELEEFLDQELVGRLATSVDGYPYIVPLCFVYYRGCIYLHSGQGGQKLENIKRNPQVCFQVDRINKFYQGDKACNYSLDYKSVIIFGKALEVEEANEKEEALRVLASRFIPSDQEVSSFNPGKLKNTVVVKIEVDKITFKANEKPD